MAEINPAVAVARDHDDGVTEGELIGNIMAAHHQVELAVAGDVGRGWRIEEADPARGGDHGKYRRGQNSRPPLLPGNGPATDAPRPAFAPGRHAPHVSPPEALPPTPPA